jgi:hypothetical protein
MPVKTKPTVTQVTEPVVKIQHSKNDCTSVYVLRDKTQKFRNPGVKDESPRAWYYGPAIVTQRISPQCTVTDEYHPDSPNVWKWLGALIQVGSYAMCNDELSAKIPQELKAYWG